MLLSGQVVPHQRNINRRTHANRVQCLDLLSHQIECQMRMRRANLCRVIRKSVMTLCEDRHRVYMPHFDGFREGPGVEFCSNVLAVFRSVEVQVYLTKTKRVWSHEKTLSF